MDIRIDGKSLLSEFLVNTRRNQIKLDLRECTIKELREALKDFPDDLKIDVYGSGNTGLVEGVELEIIKYENLDSVEIYLNIEAESGYH